MAISIEPPPKNGETTFLTLFGNNSKLLTTLTIEGRDTGARVTIPLEISKNITGTQFTQGETGVTLK